MKFFLSNRSFLQQPLPFVQWLFFSSLLYSCQLTVQQERHQINRDAIACNATVDLSVSIDPASTSFLATVERRGRKQQPPKGMVFIPGGVFSMGCADAAAVGAGHETMSDARPVHRVEVAPFFMDETEVTNRQFLQFVEATGYLTTAEKLPTGPDVADVPATELYVGSLVFSPPSSQASLQSPAVWWVFKKGADWRHPEGRGSSIENRLDEPAVHVSWHDAQAYAQWTGKRLPTEAEWEFAARGGLAGKLYSWGNEFNNDGPYKANTYQGIFPQRDEGRDGFAGVAPAKQFASNGYGLYDMAGNVWEWCADWYRADAYALQKGDSLARNPNGPSSSFDSKEPGSEKKVQRGGSFLCTDQYCTRYLVGSRGKGEVHTSSNHVGFRCVKDVAKRR